MYVNTLDQDMYGVEVDIRQKKYMGEDQEGKKIDKCGGASSRRVTQEFGVQAERS